MSYEWYLNNTQIPGSNVLKVINRIYRTASGFYKCLIYNDFGKLFSDEHYVDVKCKFICLLQKKMSSQNIYF